MEKEGKFWCVALVIMLALGLSALIYFSCCSKQSKEKWVTVCICFNDAEWEIRQVYVAPNGVSVELLEPKWKDYALATDDTHCQEALPVLMQAPQKQELPQKPQPRKLRLGEAILEEEIRLRPREISILRPKK